MTLDLRPTIAEDRKSVTVEFNGTWSVLQRPIKEKKIKGPRGREVTIQLPEVDVAKAEASIRLNDGGYALIGGGIEFKVDDRRVERVALLHVKVIEMAAEELRGGS